MKKATNIQEIYQVFDYTRYLREEDHEFFVNLYDVELKRFAAALNLTNDPAKLFLIAGQSGNGKSSILHNIIKTFPDKLQGFDFHYLDGREVFLNDDIDIIDILIMIGYRLVKDDPDLTDKFKDGLVQIEKIYNNEREVITESTKTQEKGANIAASGSLGATLLGLFSSRLGFEANYRNNNVARQQIRDFFKVRKSDLIDLINQIIFEYKRSRNLDKTLVMVIDDLEKKSDVDHIFTQELYLIKQIKMIKIMTVPIYLKRDHYFADTDIREFSLALKDRNGKKREKSYQLLEEVIDRRIEKKELLEEEAKQMAIEYSGGNLRQLIKLINFAAEDAFTYDAKQIGTHEMQNAVERIQRDLSSLVMSKAKFLEYIHEHKMIDQERLQDHTDMLAEATRSGLVFAYFNGITWYDINPLVEKVIDEYLHED